MRPSTASIRRFHFSVVIVSQLADQQAAVLCRLLAESVAKVPKSVRPFFREKTKQAATVHRCSFRTTTEVAGELDTYDVVHHSIIRSARLELGKFVSHAAKRVLQHYRRV